MSRPVLHALLAATLLLGTIATTRATPLNDDLLAPAAPRPAPRNRPEIAPRPAIFTSRSVVYAARSGDGRWIATVEKGDEGDELWLQPAVPSTELPRLIHTSPVRLSAPALSRDGKLLAYVDSRDDVKGDIWLFDLGAGSKEPRRITGPEAADDAPVFTTDSTALVYQRQLPGADRRELVRLDYRTGASSVLAVGIDAGFAAPSPDGVRWVLVSRGDDPGGDLWLWNERTGERTQLTAGLDRDLYPVWEPDGNILFTRFPATADGANGQIWRLRPGEQGGDGRPARFPLTAGTIPALAPIPAVEGFLFVGGEGSGGQLLTLPTSGEVPRQATVAAQWELAKLIMERQPPDPPHARLAAWRVLAREEAPSREGALAGIALGQLREKGNDPDGAAAAYATVVKRSGAFPADTALAEIARLRVTTAERCSGEKDPAVRTRLINEATTAMNAAARDRGSDPAVRALIDSARLLADQGTGAADQLAATRLLEQSLTLPGVSRPLLAEAAYRHGALLARLEKGEGALKALTGMARDFGDQEEWAEAAITAILDQLAASAGEGQAGYAALAERYRIDLPRLAMGAWNRIGDLNYRDNEWAKAKDAYRTVLEKFPPLPTPTAAARFALAEILYREERYAEATTLYEQEMAGRPEDAPLYQLARAAYIRKTLAAGESLYQNGEVSAARATFLDLIRYDGRSVEAHRGYIKSVAAQGQAPELLALYNRLLVRYPDDPVLLYSSGLTETYLPGREHLAAADARIARAAERMPESEYPPQTRGYIAEVMETVQGERGGLERAMQLYRRAWLLNRGRENPENRANLELNIGNTAYLLGSNATAWSHYRRRLASGIPFDNPETELIFLQRYAAVAFQMREKEEPINGYTRALQLADGRLNPARPLELAGRLTRRIVERLFQARELSGAATKALQEQQDINAELERLGSAVPEAPPSAGWDRFSGDLKKQLDRERALLDNAPSWNREGTGRYGAELQALLKRVEESLADVPRLVETSAELHDRLGLALLEAERFGPAREQFDTAFRLNRGLGRTGNLVANRRSASVAAYREAQGASGGERQRLLRLARDGFREELSLIKEYPPQPKKPATRGGGLISVGATVALDKGASTQAAYGFSAIQEERLAETFLARILSELGEPAVAGQLLRQQLAGYPTENDRIKVGDLYGVGLLTHRTAHVDYALGDRTAAAAGFRRSTLLSLQAGNPVSAMLNLVNWGELTADSAPADTLADFLAVEARTAQLAGSYRDTLPPLALARFHNDVGTIIARRAAGLPDDASRQALLYRGVDQWNRALAAANERGGEGRERLLLRAAVQLNKGTVLAGLGLGDAAAAANRAALDEARSSRADNYVWRALAALGRYDEALKELDRLPPAAWDAKLGEIRERFAPRLAQLAATDPEGAFALLERLSELERVEILGRSLLGLGDPAVRTLLATAAPHLAELDNLRAKLAAAKPVEREYLDLRQRQEQTLVDGLLGTKLERLPAIYTQAGISLLKLAAAGAALQESAEKGAPAADEGSVKERYAALLTDYRKGCMSGKEGRLCRAVTPQPVEAVDILEMMPGRTVLRFTPLSDGRWLLFTLGGKKGITAETLDRPALEQRLAATSPALAAYEEPQPLANAPVAGWGLSATQLFRSLEERRPFRRLVLDPSGWWPAADQFAKLPTDRPEAQLPFAHTLVLPGRAGLLPQVPSEPGRGETVLPLWEDATGTRRPLTDLVGSNGVSLVIAPRAGREAAYGLGQLLTLVGVPTLLVADSSATAPPAFTAAYATASVGAARATLPAGWLLIGDTGPDTAEAAKLGKRQFTAYGKEGVQAHNAGRYAEALALFENGLAIAAENPDLAKYRSTLERYARESAYAAGDTDKAIVHADALLALMAKEKPYSADHADAYLRLGLLQGRAERFTQAAASLKEAVGIYADLGLAKEQASALADFGVVMENAVEYPQARSLFEEAAGIRRTLKDEIPLAEQYRNLGRLFDLRLNRYAEAKTYYARAGEIYARAGKSALEAETLLEQGRCQRLLGNFPAADELYRKALAQAGDQEPRTRMRIVLEQANNAWFQGRYQEAFDKREEVEKAARREKWPLEQVMTKNTGGLIWWTLGDNRRALLELKEALGRAEKLEVRRDEVATTLNNIGLVLRESGDYTEALATLEKALAIDRKLGSRWAMAYDLRNLAQTRVRMGDPAAAVPLLTEAAAMAAAIGDRVNLAKISLARGDAEAALKNPAAAEAGYKKAHAEADAMLLREVSWRALFGLARLRQGAGDMETAVATYRQAMETVENLRAEIRLDQLKDGFLADKQELYGALVSLLVDLKREDEAFSVAERSRARNLIDILGRQRLSLNGEKDKELYERQNRLREQIQEQESLLSQAAEKDKAIYAVALERLRADYQDLLLEIERQRPELMSLVKVQPVELKDVQSELEPGVLLLSYYQLADRLLCWRIGRDAARLFILTTTAKALATEITSYRRMLQNLEPLEVQSRALYDQLLAGPLTGLGEEKVVGIIPHGSLHYLSFATLSDGRDYLVDRQRLFYLPAASVLRYTLARRQTVKNLKVLAIGNPDLGDPSLALPFAEREARTLRWDFPSVTILTRDKATESWVREHIGDFGIIHLASHGEFDPVNPLFSAIRLAPDKRSDGKLLAEDIFGLPIKADLVVLSACQTGLGDIRKGDDVVGMNRAFIFAGTHALVSSLWRVSDVSTAILMKQFYREYRRNDKAESLRRAMLHVKNRYPHPGYWGAFTLIGDYQ